MVATSALDLAWPKVIQGDGGKIKTDFIDGTEPASTVEVSEQATETFRVLREMMYPVVCAAQLGLPITESGAQPGVASVDLRIWRPFG